MANTADKRSWAMTAARGKLAEIKREDATAARTARIYREANKLIQGRVQKLYAELGELDEKNNTYYFKGLNTPATTRSAQELRKKIEAAGLTQYVPANLQRRLSVYEAMELDNWYTMTKAGQDAQKTLKNAFAAQIKDQGEIWQRAFKAGGAAFVGFDRNQVGYMLGQNWYGGNFSSRLWNETQASWGKVQEEIAKAMASGQDPAVTRRKVAEILVGAHRDGVRGSGGLQYDVERILRTEMARAATQADIIKWEAEGVKEVQWNARLESHTCENCAELDGKIFKLEEARNMLPLHPNCRCFITPYDREYEENLREDQRQRQFKTEDGDYELVNWAPLSEFERDGQGFVLASAVMRGVDYFFNGSPWTKYEPARTGLKYVGELDYNKNGDLVPGAQAVVNLTENSIQAVADKYPEIMKEFERSANNKVELIKNNDGKTAGETQKKQGQTPGYIKLAYPYQKGISATKTLEELAKQAQVEYKKKYWSTPNVNHTINHELGHMLANNLEWRGGDTKAIVLKATRKTTTEAALKSVAKNISRYGGKNLKDAFAEIFAKAQDQDATTGSKLVARFVQEIDKQRATLPAEPQPKSIKVA